jgi:Ras-related protein Rab-2A
MSEESKYKFIVCGEKAVGKTSLVYRYINGKFKQSTMGTVGVDMFTKKISFDGQNIGLTIWDFGGEEKFRTLLPRYCMGTQGAMFLFDLTNHTSFEALDNWIQIINKYIPESKKILIASKADLADQREVTEDEALEFQQNRKIDLYLECSSKTGQNVDEIFDSLMNAILSSFIRCPFCNEPNSKEAVFCKHCNRKLK